MCKYAEDVGHYWKTSQSDPDTWIDKAKRQIKEVGGIVRSEGFGVQDGKAAYMLAFQIGDDPFRVVWPVLLSRSKDTRSAKRQAATMLYHHIKAACMSAAILGTRAAFFTHLMLSDGRVMSEISTPELLDVIPPMLTHKETVDE